MIPVSHFLFRSKHGASKLKHAKDLSEYAQKWAESLAAKGDFQHSDCVLKGERIGENIACKWSSSGADYTGMTVEKFRLFFPKHFFFINVDILTVFSSFIYQFIPLFIPSFFYSVILFLRTRLYIFPSIKSSFILSFIHSFFASKLNSLNFL